MTEHPTPAPLALVASADPVAGPTLGTLRATGAPPPNQVGGEAPGTALGESTDGPASPEPTAPDPAAPDPTASVPTAPDPTAPDPTAPDPTAPDPTAPVPTASDLTTPSGDAGMSTVEYAVGTVVAAAFAAVLYRIVTGDSIVAGLTALVQSALNTRF